MEKCLIDLEKKNFKEFKKLFETLKRMAKHGTPKNVQIFKTFKGYNNLHEIKVNQIRILWKTRK